MTSWLSVQKVVLLCVAGAVGVVLLSGGVRPAGAAVDGMTRIELEDPFGWPTILPDGRLMTWWEEEKALDEGAGEQTDAAGLLVDSVRVNVKP